MADTAPTADELLAHTDWLTQLARALAGDANAADVVQATYEVALTRPPSRGGPLRPWLGGVARNIARMSVRGRARRELREDRAALAPADPPTPEQLVERVQMQQQVARIVLELPEPLRATLLLRFFEGLSAAEIARVQRIPAATVRGRLKDALDRVRATLDARPGGRKRWLALLGPIPLPGGKTALVTGGLIVKTGVKLAIALVVLLVVAIGTRQLGWWGGSDAPATAATDGSAARPNPPKPAVPTRPVAARGGSLRTIEIVHDDDPKGTLRLEGQVIDEQAAPVANAKVAIDAHPTIVVTTEGDGSFVFEGLIPRDYRLEATGGDGYAGPARLRLTDKTEPVTLRMKRAGTVEVVVTEAGSGRPVSGADVELRSVLVWTARTDAKGVAQLRGVGATWAPLAVRAAGFAPAGNMLSTSGDPAAPARVAITLERGAALAGRVVDDGGKPVEGARVVATSASEPFPVIDPRRDGVVTKPDGTFSFPTIAAGTWRLTASHGDHAPATSAPVTVDGAHARGGIELVLESGGVVRGVVRDADKQPVAAADVRVVVRGTIEWRARRQAFTAADGTFAITGLPRRVMDIVAAHETAASAIVPVDLAARREHDVDLVLDITGVVTGTVVDRSGQPVGDAQVIAAPIWSGSVEDRAAWSVRGVQETVTDQGGTFRFAGLPDGGYRLRAARPGVSESRASLAPAVEVRPGGAPVQLVVGTDGRIVGKVALADGRAPARFTIEIGDAYAMPFADRDGKFALAAPAGEHTLVVRGPGFVAKIVKSIAVSDGKDTDVGTIEVASGRSVSGRVVDASGAPVAKARVAAGPLLTGGGKELYIADESPGAKDTTTDADGRFSLDGFAPAPIMVLAGTDTARSQSVRIPPGPDSATLELVLAPTTGVDGKVTRDGKPLGDTVIIANPTGALGSNFFTTTGPDGTFALDALAPGTYVVYPMIGGGGGEPKDMYVRKIELALGTRAKVDIDATAGALSLAVSVKTAAGPVPMAMVLGVQAAIAPATLDELRDGVGMPFSDQPIPIYMRMAMGGATELDGMRPGVHTVCAAIGQPGDPDSRMKCQQITLDAATPKKSLAIVLPSK